MITLEQHMATLKAKDDHLTGEDIRVPFPAICATLHQRGIEGQRVLVTAVMERVAIVCARDTPPALIHSDRTIKTQVRLYAITVDPADVQVVDRSAHRAKVVAAARGRKASINSSFAGHRRGEGARQAAERAETAQDARRGV